MLRKLEPLQIKGQLGYDLYVYIYICVYIYMYIYICIYIYRVSCLEVAVQRELGFSNEVALENPTTIMRAL